MNYTLCFSLFFGIESKAIERTLVPSTFENNRVFISVPFQGVSANLLLDSGGSTGVFEEFSWYWKTMDSNIVDHNLQFGTQSPFSASIPEDTLQKRSLRMISSMDEEARLVRKVIKDGILGHAWLGTRIWEIDYTKKTLSRLQTSEKAKGNEVKLSFKNEKLFYPRMTIIIDGEKLDVLLDTGGTSFFSEEAMKIIGLKEAFSASSFIRESIFDHWKKKHPDWLIIENGDRMGKQPLIRVPQVEVAGNKIGPIWFARRSNKSYDEMMAQYMDCNCSGAIGGNVLGSFSITLDYPKKAACFDLIKN